MMGQVVVVKVGEEAAPIVVFVGRIKKVCEELGDLHQLLGKNVVANDLQ